MGKLEEGAGRVETADANRCCASPVDPNLAASVFHCGDVSQNHSQPRRPVAGKQGMYRRDLEFAHAFGVVAFVPPDRVAASAHVHRLRSLHSDCIRTRRQWPYGKPADRLRQQPDVDEAHPADTECNVQMKTKEKP